MTVKTKNHQQPLLSTPPLGSCKSREENRVKDIEWSKSNYNKTCKRESYVIGHQNKLVSQVLNIID
jgi:hypothetical protein